MCKERTLTSHPTSYGLNSYHSHFASASRSCCLVDSFSFRCEQKEPSLSAFTFFTASSIPGGTAKSHIRNLRKIIQGKLTLDCGKNGKRHCSVINMSPKAMQRQMLWIKLTKIRRHKDPRCYQCAIDIDQRDRACGTNRFLHDA